MAFLSLNGVGKRYGALEVLKDISLDLTEGEFLVLLGPSGCGKSTLLATIAGLESHSAGTIVLDGHDVTRLRPADRDIAMVFQSYALYPSMTVAQNLGFGLEMRRVPKAQRAEAVARVAKTLQIESLLARRPSQLSGGQRQRVAIGRALVREPKLFLFDEPLSNLDAKLRVDMRSEIKRLHMRTGTTFVYVTHDQLEAMTLATRIAVMRDGRILQHGSPAEIYRDPADVFVATFIGSPAMNLVAGTVAGTGSGTVDVRIAGDGAGLGWTLRRDRFRGVPTVGTDVLVGVRPEHIARARDGAVPPGWAAVPVRTELVEPAGADTFAAFTLAGQPVVARLEADADLAPGRDETVGLDLGKAVLFDSATGKRL